MTFGWEKFIKIEREMERGGERGREIEKGRVKSAIKIKKKRVRHGKIERM